VSHKLFPALTRWASFCRASGAEEWLKPSDSHRLDVEAREYVSDLRSDALSG